MSVPSPCISVCEMSKLDQASKLCKGCWRTIEEIVMWRSATDDAKKAVLLLIEERKLASKK